MKYTQSLYLRLLHSEKRRSLIRPLAASVLALSLLFGTAELVFADDVSVRGHLRRDGAYVGSEDLLFF